MANTVTNQNKPSGLTPVRYLNGADWTGQSNIYFVPYTDTNAYWPGDLVAPLAGVDQWSGLQSCVLATTSSALCLGVVIGIGATGSETQSRRGGPFIDPTNLNIVNAPATKTQNYFLQVVDDPNVLFEIQETGAGTTAATSLTYTSTSKLASFVYGAPATGVNVSGTTLDNGVASGNTPETGTTVTNGYFLRMMGLAQKIDPQTAQYNTYGLYAKWIVKLTNHVYGVSTGTGY